MIRANIEAGSHILVQGNFQTTTAASQVISSRYLPCLISSCFQIVLTDQEPNYEVLQLLSNLNFYFSNFVSSHGIQDKIWDPCTRSKAFFSTGTRWKTPPLYLSSGKHCDETLAML